MRRLSAFVLGSAAGGGFPQWNCGCPVCRLAWAGDPRVKPRTQASLAVTAVTARQRGFVLNASPDLRQQLLRHACLQPRGLREQPDRGRRPTGAEVDQTAGLLTLRERGSLSRSTAPRRRSATSPPIRSSACSPPTWCRRRRSAPASVSRCPAASRPSCSWCRARRRSISKATLRRSPPRPRPMSASRSPAARTRLVFIPGRGEAHQRSCADGCATPTWCCSTARSSPTTR